MYSQPKSKRFFTSCKDSSLLRDFDSRTWKVWWYCNDGKDWKLRAVPAQRRHQGQIRQRKARDCLLKDPREELPSAWAWLLHITFIIWSIRQRIPLKPVDPAEGKLKIIEDKDTKMIVLLPLWERWSFGCHVLLNYRLFYPFNEPRWLVLVGYLVGDLLQWRHSDPLAFGIILHHALHQGDYAVEALVV